MRDESAWAENIVQQLKVLAQIFVNALARIRVKEALHESKEKPNIGVDAWGAGQ